MQIPPTLANSLTPKPQADRMLQALVSQRMAQQGAVKSGALSTSATAPGTVASNIPQGSAPTGGPLQSSPGSLNLDQFFAAWGTDNPEFDVTQDGIVNAADLAVLLGDVQETPIGAQAPAPNQTPAQVSPQDVLAAWGQNGGAADLDGNGVVDAADLTIALGNAQPNPTQAMVDGVQKAWGSSDENFDFNGDGTVDGADLAIALSGTVNAPNAASGATGGELTAEPAPVAPELAKTAASLADAILSARGAEGEGTLSVSDLSGVEALLGPVDPDGDGTITREDLADRFARRLEAETSMRPDADIRKLAAQWLQSLVGGERSAGDPRTALAREAYSGGGAGPIDRLHKQLAANGFESTPPSNIDRLVGGLAPDRASRATMLRGLASRYPNGLGVNARA